MRQYALQRLGCRNWYQFRNAHPLSLGMSLRRRSIIPLDKPADPSEGPTRRLAQTSRSTAAAQLEAILFLSREPLSLRRLAKLLRIDDVGQLRETLTELNVMYDREGAAFRIEEVGGGFLLLTRKRFVTWLRRLHGMTIEVRLSQPAMETLAVIAYRQPVLRAEIESVRGVQSGEMVRQLIDRDLVRIVGRSEQLGRPMLYGTTHRFLEVFGLGRIEELHQAKKDKKPLQKAAGMEREIVPIEHEATSPDELVENIENNPDIIQFPKTDQEDELMEELNQGQEQEQIEAEVEAGTDCDRDEDEWEEEEGEEEEWEEEDGDEDEEEWEEVEEDDEEDGEWEEDEDEEGEWEDEDEEEEDEDLQPL